MENSPDPYPATQHDPYRQDLKVKQGRTFLWLFLLPVLLVALLAALIDLWSLNSLGEQNRARTESAQKNLFLLTETAQLGRQMAAVHQLAADSLRKATEGTIDEGGLYLIHSEIVDVLADIEEKTRLLIERPEVMGPAQEHAQVMVESYDQYQNFIIMATDIAAIDPQTANLYIDKAQALFMEMIKHRQNIFAILTEHAKKQNIISTHSYDKVFSRLMAFSVIGLLVMLVLSIVSAKMLSGWLSNVAKSLYLLAQTKGAPVALPEMKRMQQRGIGELKEMATATLAFRRAIQERYEAETKLTIYQNDLEELVARRTTELHLTTERLKLATESAGIGIWDFNVMTNEMRWDDEMCKLYGIDSNDFSGTYQAWQDMVHPDDYPAVAADFQAALAGEKEFDAEFRVVRPNQDEHIVMANAMVLRDDSGDPLHMIGVNREITQQRLAEEKMLAVRERLMKAQEIAHLGNWEWSIISNKLYWSEEIYRIFGLDPHKTTVDYDTFLAIVHADDRAAVRLAVEKALEFEVGCYEIEYRIVRPDGVSRFVHEQGEVVFNETGKPLKMVGTVLDITVRKDVERELIEAKELAEAATRAKGEFLANMSHEIRTPMNAILGMTYLAQQTTLTSQQQDYLSKTYAAANALLGLINDILDFSKIEAGKLEVESVEFQLDDVLTHVANLVNQQSDQKELDLLLSIPTDLPKRLKGDPLRLGQVLINLANNAVKFTEQGEIVIAIQCLKEEAEQVVLRFSIKDTGIGMSKEQMAVLFQAFSQADTTTTRKYGGTGLGLSISKQLVELMKGEISVDSEPGQGTTFSFTAVFGMLPVEAQEKQLIPQEISGMNVLVVDDSSTARQVLQEMLESFGCQTTGAVSGEEALDKLNLANEQGQPFKLVLMDYMMAPGLDGLDVSRLIRNNEKLDIIPAIIMVTGYDREEVKRRCKAEGLDEFLTKPVTVSLLFNTIMHVFATDSSKQEIYAVKTNGVDLKQHQYLQGGKILLVEDNDINQQVAMELLTQVGLDVDVVNNGLEGVEAFSQKSYKLILMDIQMPEMDGYRAARAIRDLELKEHEHSSPAARIPIIAMTAHAMAGDREKSLVAGMDDHINKPIDPAQLYDVVAKWLPEESRTQLPVSDKQGKIASKSAVEPATVELPMTLPGLDLAVGIKRLEGNRQLYLKLLKEFSEDNPAFTGEIKEALASGDRETAQRIAHTIKGVAGNLGAGELYLVASDLEAAIKQGARSKIERLLRGFDSTLREVLRSIAVIALKDKKNDQGAKPQEARPLDIATLSPLLVELDHILKESSFDVVNYVAQLKKHVAGTWIEKDFDLLERHIAKFDFEAALLELEKINGKL